MAHNKKAAATRKYTTPVSKAGRGFKGAGKTADEREYISIYASVPTRIYRAVIEDAEEYGLTKSHHWRKWIVEGYARDFLKKGRQKG